MVQQIIQDRYIDPVKLQNMLACKFIPGSYSSVVCHTIASFGHLALTIVPVIVREQQMGLKYTAEAVGRTNFQEFGT